MSASELTALLLFCTAMSFSPGPNTTLSTALAANLGLRRAMRFCLAVPAGWTLLMLATGLGLGALITGVPALRWSVTLLGVVYMLWLAWKLAGAGQLSQVDASRLNVGFWQGVGLQFLNIKAWMLALTLTAGWVVNAAGQPADNPGQRLTIICGVRLLGSFWPRDEFFAGPEHDAVHGAGGQPGFAARHALLPGGARRLDPADAGHRPGVGRADHRRARAALGRHTVWRGN